MLGLRVELLMAVEVQCPECGVLLGEWKEPWCPVCEAELTGGCGCA